MTKAKEPKPPRPKRAGPATPANPTTGSFQVSDELWAVLAPLIPQRVNTHPRGGGRPRVPDRTCANGIFYRAAYRLPVEGAGRHGHLLRAPPLICASRNGWPPGCSWNYGQVGLERYDELQGLDWSWLSLDGALTKAPLGGGKNRAQSHRPG